MIVRPLSVALLAGVMSTCGNQVRRSEPVAAQEPAPATTPPAPRLFDPATTDASELVRSVRAALETDPAEARRLAEVALEAGAAPDERARLLWLAAEAAHRRDDVEARLTHLRALGATDHALARWATLRIAEALEPTEPAEALVLAEPLGEGRWAGALTARRIAARAALATAGDDAEATAAARAALRALVEATPAHVGAASVGMPLAEHLAASEDPAEREEALALFRRVATRAPKAEVGQRAAARASEVLATLPEERREALAAVPFADRFVQAEALYGSMHHADAEAAFAALARDLPEEDAAGRCRARLMQGRAMLRRRRREEGAPLLRRVAEECEDTDVKAWARYKAGRAYTQIDRREDAIAQFDLLEREAPAHRLADDALFRAALLEAGRGDEEAMKRRLASLPDAYPEGDMVGEALFRLFLHAHDAGEHEEALRWLDRLLAARSRAGLVPGEEPEDRRGRAAYWRGRTLQALERPTEATEAWAGVARRWPLSYYAQQALARLGEVDGDRAEAVLAEMREPEPTPLRFPWRDELDAPWMERAVELLRVGAIPEAIAELVEAGAVGEGADDDLVWLVAALLERAGARAEVARLVRRRLDSFRRTLPTGRGRQLWRLAYPRAFAPLIETHAEAQEVPPSFVRAIAREESSFEPTAVSWAHAYGLVQLILPTARRWGRDLDVRITPASLKRPEVNLAVGTRYMRYLRGRFPPPLVPASYNAGQGALARWLRTDGERDLDDFVEHIPYDETRRYTRRVVQTWGVYAWLDEGELPPLPRRLR